MLKVAPVMQLAGREARERARLLPSIMQVRVCVSPQFPASFDTTLVLFISFRLFCFTVAIRELDAKAGVAGLSMPFRACFPSADLVQHPPLAQLPPRGGLCAV